MALYGKGVRDLSQRSPKGGKLLPICCISCAPAVSHPAAENPKVQPAVSHPAAENPKVQTCRESTSSLEEIFIGIRLGASVGDRKIN